MANGVAICEMSRRAEELCIASGHTLLVGNITLKLCKAKVRHATSKQIDSDILKDAGDESGLQVLTE